MNIMQKMWHNLKNIFSSNNNEFKRSMQPDELEEGFLGKMVQKIGYSLKGVTYREYSMPSFDLTEIEKAYNTDSYVRQAVDEYIELMFKQGWEFTYRDQKVKQYLSRRLVMISDQMGQPFSHFLKEVSEDLVKYHNVFIAKKRRKADNQPSMPGVDIQPLKHARYPVATYDRIPPETMQIKTDEYGTVKMYKQVVGGKEKKFNPKEIIHIAYKKPAGKLFGVPFLLPALDDVRLLRKMEDNVSKLLYRHLYPLFVYTVGTGQAGDRAEPDEISDMKRKIEDMPIDGGLVIPGRHDIDLLTVNEDIGAEKFLKYFERRVFTGLGVSETLMGRSGTSNRSTAENQSSEMRDKVKAIQSVFESYMNHILVRELLMEGGFDPVINEKDQAKFKFNEIDVDLLIKRENHSIYKFEHNATTHEEMREDLSKEPVEDESRLNANMFNDTTLEEDPDQDNDRSEDEGDNNHSSELDKYSDVLYQDKIFDLTAQLKSEVHSIFISKDKPSNEGNEEEL